MLLTPRQRQRRKAAMKWGSFALLAALMLAPKMDDLTIPDLSFPLVTTAVAAE